MNPILDINTFIERKVIKIDGSLYEMSDRKELTVLGAQKLNLLYKKIAASEDIKKPTKAQSAEYVKQLRQFVGTIVLNLPGRVLSRLARPDLVAIIKAYFQSPQVQPTPRKGTKAGATAATSTGAK